MSEQYEREAFMALRRAWAQEHDFAAFLTGVVTAVCADVGGVEELIAGRPGSWESAKIEDWMESAGCRSDLAAQAHAEHAEELLAETTERTQNR